MTILEVLALPRDNPPTTPGDVPPAEFVARTAETLARLGMRIDVQRVGERTTIAVLTHEDGWETIGVASTKTPWRFDTLLGTKFALQHALDQLERGRFFDHPHSPKVANAGDACESPRAFSPRDPRR